MRKGKGILEIGFFLSLFIIIIAVYFKFSDRGQNNIVIPLSDAFIDAVDIKGVIYETAVDFDIPANRQDPTAFISGKAHTGNFANALNAEHEYSFGIETKWSDLKLYGAVNKVKFTFWVFSEEKLKDAVAVFSTDSVPGKSIDWQSNNIELREFGKWSQITIAFPVNPATLKSSYLTKIYIWNRSKQSFLVDDFSVEFLRAENQKFEQLAFNLNRTILNDFESNDSSQSSGTLNVPVHSGNSSFDLSGKDKYSPAIEKHIYEVSSEEISLITLGVWVYPEEDELDVVLVVTIAKPDGSEYFWEGRSTDKGVFPQGKWTKHRGQFKLPSEKISKDDIIKAYIWNKKGSKIFIDDFEVVFGEQQSRPGSAPLVDMEKTPESGYVFQRNRAPFRVINMAPVSSIVQTDVVPESIDFSELSEYGADANIVSAKLIKGSGLSQLVIVKGSELHVYGYCAAKKKFEQILNGELSFKTGQHQLAALDIDGDGTDELFITGKESKGYFIKLSNFIQPCASGIQKQNIQPIFEINLPGSESDTIPGNYTSIAIDRNNDLNFELIVTNSVNNNSMVYFLKGNVLQQEALKADFTESNPQIEYLMWQGAKSTSNGKLYCLEILNGVRSLHVYSWDQQTQSFINSDDVDFLPIELIEPACQIFKSGFEMSDGSDFFVFNSQYRFELKSMKKDEAGYFITSSIDFKRTSPDLNPKFFEISRLYSGKFTGNSRVELIVFSADCSDTGFYGTFCNKLEKNYRVTMFTTEQ